MGEIKEFQSQTNKKLIKKNKMVTCVFFIKNKNGKVWVERSSQKDDFNQKWKWNEPGAN